MVDHFSLDKTQISHLLEYGEVELKGKKISVHDFLSDHHIDYQVLRVAHEVILKLNTQLAQVHNLLTDDSRKYSYDKGDKDLQYRQSLLKRIQKFEDAFSLIKQKIHPQKTFGFFCLSDQIHLKKGSPEIVEFREIKKALKATKKIASVEIYGSPLFANGESDHSSTESCMLDSKNRYVITGNGYGATVSSTTWGNTRLEDVHSIMPTLSLDASCYLRTEDGSGIIVSADGYGRGHDDNGPLDRNIAYIAHQACNYLSKVLKDSSGPDEIIVNANRYIEETDEYLKECNKTEIGQLSGSANVACVRIFSEANKTRVHVVGISVGNQMIMLTNAKTGETFKLNSGEFDENAYKCSLGGNDAQGRQYVESDIKVIDFSMEMTPSDALVWIATCGSWQNFDAEGHVTRLGEEIGKNTNPIDLVNKLSDRIQKNSGSAREKIPELFSKLNALDIRKRKEVDETKKLEIKSEAERTQEEIRRLHQRLDDATITVFRPFITQ